MPRCLHEWIKTANGHMDLDVAAFCAFVWPVVEELYRKGKGARPTPEEITGALYDVLSVAGVEITTTRHGHGAQMRLSTGQLVRTPCREPNRRTDVGECSGG